MDDDEWLSAKETMRLAVGQLNSVSGASGTICSRAHDGLIRTRARRLAIGSQTHDNREVPLRFWWARGEAALDQNWVTGDFETWLDQKIHMRAYGVEFRKDDVLLMLGLNSVPQHADTKAPGKGGRPRGDFWEQMLVDVFKTVYDGDFKPKVQADIERAMMDWAIAREHETTITSVRPRARLIWQAIKDEDKNPT